jgi:hypothetical protein
LETQGWNNHEARFAGYGPPPVREADFVPLQRGVSNPAAVAGRSTGPGDPPGRAIHRSGRHPQ